MKHKIAFIGSGRMASAMVKGIIGEKVFQPDEIICTSAKDGTAEALSKATGISLTYNFEDLLQNAKYVVLACKPQQLDSLPGDLAKRCTAKYILSILAGVTIQRLQTKLPYAANWIRVMPNTPGQIRAGISAFAFHHQDSQEVQSTITKILGALGEVVEIEEKNLDAVTGLSGSGPAYVFEFIAGLRDAGIAQGLNPDVSYALAIETVLGAAKLLKAVPESPETHRDWVSSPGGTTLAGLAILEKNGLRDILQKTVQAATQRSKELANLKA